MDGWVGKVARRRGEQILFSQERRGKCFFFFSLVARLSFSGSIAWILRRFTCARTALAGRRGLMVGWMDGGIDRQRGLCCAGEGGQSMIGGSMLKKLSDVLTRTVFTSTRHSVWLREMLVMLDSWSRQIFLLLSRMRSRSRAAVLSLLLRCQYFDLVGRTWQHSNELANTVSKQNTTRRFPGKNSQKKLQ